MRGSRRGRRRRSASITTRARAPTGSRRRSGAIARSPVRCRTADRTQIQAVARRLLARDRRKAHRHLPRRRRLGRRRRRHRVLPGDAQPRRQRHAGRRPPGLGRARAELRPPGHSHDPDGDDRAPQRPRDRLDDRAARRRRAPRAHGRGHDRRPSLPRRHLHRPRLPGRAHPGLDPGADGDHRARHPPRPPRRGPRAARVLPAGARLGDRRLALAEPPDRGLPLRRAAPRRGRLLGGGRHPRPRSVRAARRGVQQDVAPARRPPGGAWAGAAADGALTAPDW